MSPTAFLDGRVTLYAGDCMDVLAGLPDNSVDSVVTDPPYHLTNRTPDVKWCVECRRVLGGQDGKPDACPRCGGSLENQRSQGGRGFMGKQWDGGDIAFQPATWAAVLRVLKPGGHMVAFSGTRTYHRMVCAIEDAGFEIRDQLAWMYGSGFPKSHDVSKGIDKAAGAEREVVGFDESKFRPNRVDRGMVNAAGGSGFHADNGATLTAPATDAAREWQGWGTALKPAWEPICLARKPLIGTVAENVLAHGTGALNIDGCRIKGEKPDTTRGAGGQNGAYSPLGAQGRIPDDGKGRWPANLLLDGSDEVLAGFPETTSGGGDKSRKGTTEGANCFGVYGAPPPDVRDIDSGSAARFFYTAKADSEDRLGSKHPTVKPLDLKQYLCRLITPPGGTVLDLFAGTGTTGEAAWREGFWAILIEREAEYLADIARRMELAVLPTKRAAVAKTKNKLMGAEGTPLFGGAA